MRDRVKKAFDLLQGLTIKSTEYNVSAIEFTLNTLRDVYKMLEKEDSNDQAE